MFTALSYQVSNAYTPVQHVASLIVIPPSLLPPLRALLGNLVASAILRCVEEKSPQGINAMCVNVVGRVAITSTAPFITKRILLSVTQRHHELE